MDTGQLLAQLGAQAGSVIVIVALLRLAVRRIAGTDPDADTLLGLNLAANVVLSVLIAAQQGLPLSLATLAMVGLVSLGATATAHGAYDLIANRAKGDGSSSSLSENDSADPAYPPGVPLDAITSQLAPAA